MQNMLYNELYRKCQIFMPLNYKWLIMKDGIPFSPTHSEGLGRLITLLTAAAETGAVGKMSERLDLISKINHP
jgi:hypothetical protein